MPPLATRTRIGSSRSARCVYGNRSACAVPTRRRRCSTRGRDAQVVAAGEGSSSSSSPSFASAGGLGLGGVVDNSARASSGEPMRQSLGEGYDVKNVRRNPPPDLPSIMLYNRIVFLGEELVFDVVELIAAELMYLESIEDRKPIHMYISSTGTMRPDGELVALETNGTMVYDVMNYVRPDVYTYNVGVAAGAACMLLAAGKKGRRYSYPNATALLQQPRTIATGQLQAIELDIRWKQMEGHMKSTYEILSKHTGNSVAKLEYDLKKPLYMTPLDAMEYGVIDHVRFLLVSLPLHCDMCMCMCE